MNLEGDVALVTGATRGIGQAIAAALGASGATVVGTATTLEGAERISAALKGHGVTGGGRVLNLNEVGAVGPLIDEIRDEFGAPSILVNNAGVTRDNLLMRMKDEEWDEIIATNLSSAFRTSKAVLRPMMKARRGRIINVGSVVGVTGNAGQANYAAAKAGLGGFTRSLAREVASRGITVNMVSPGFIDTDMTRALGEDRRAELSRQIPAGRLGTPEDVAAVVQFLAGPAANYVTGQTLHVNGGMYMA